MARAIVGGIGLEYELESPGRGTTDSAGAPPTVALLNGIGMSIAHWRPVADRLLAAGYRVLTHDFRGQLLSDRPSGAYSFELHARDLAELLAGLGIGRVFAVGTSYGSEVALTFARDYPGLCAGVAAIDGVTEYDDVLRAAIECWKSAALADPRTFYKSLLPWTYSAAYLAAHRDELAAREGLIAGLPRDYFEGFARLCDSFLAIRLSGDLGRISRPCLVVVGDRDILKPPRYSRIIADGVPGATYAEVAGAGHALAIEAPGELSDLLLGFFAEAAGR
ncbi:MAG TPA: alpha/beta fold hydrolase [Spirochaetia bacterium]|nr:alpha/beta fold hydrolase [Spirochaetales bacterium]HRW25165.1 alpha/beta fold hydrolase [Spirochaetia bacterium]